MIRFTGKTRKAVMVIAAVVDVALISAVVTLCMSNSSLRQQNEFLIMSSEANLDMDFKPIETTASNCKALIKDYTINKDYYGSSEELASDVRACENFLAMVQSIVR